ncbi:MAG: hydantoinase/oxoprolinase family protein [Planctomycetota bacterium]
MSLRRVRSSQAATRPSTARPTPTQSIRFGIDSGGTFTDVVALLPGRGLVVHKVPSTPRDPANAVLRGVADVLPAGAQVDLVHGTTVGLNAVLTGRLPRTAFVTNAGFEDLIEIGRQARADIYDLTAAKAQLPVPRALRFAIGSRRGADGIELRRPSQRELQALRRRLKAARVEAVAVGLLFSFAEPGDERAVADALRPLDVPITCSGELLAVAGEYERYSAAILNAAMAPVMGAYVDRLRQALAPGRVRLMRSSGGIMPSEEAARFPARAALSGPAGGVSACRALQRRLRCGPLAAFDMGGTSTDVCFVDGGRGTWHEATLGGLPLPLPAVGVHTVGCGGGSLASVDAGGALRVGPDSAGADPGPACYGRGERATVTDAHVALGHIGAETLLGGRFRIDPSRSIAALRPLAERMRCTIRRAAEGILEVADNAMVRALLVITAARAIDPARITLLAYGGAGGLHAARLAAKLAMPQVIVPAHPGAFSAVGLALASTSAEAYVPVHASLASLARERTIALCRDAARRALAELDGSGRVVELSAHVRARGQGATLAVRARGDLQSAFRREHERLFGFRPPEAALELVAVVARAEAAPRPLPAVELSSSRALEPTRRRAPVGGRLVSVYQRAALGRKSVLPGPVVIEEETGVTVVPNGWEARATPFGLVLRLT